MSIGLQEVGKVSHSEKGSSCTLSGNMNYPGKQGEGTSDNSTQQKGQRAKPKKKWTRAGITITSLNIKGYGQSGQNSKWMHINQIMHDKKIAVLSVQETHMDEDRKDKIEHLFGQRLKILASADAESPTQRAGVAIVLNKSFLNVGTAMTKEIVPGWAMWVQLDWNGGDTLMILVVYAPNAPTENASSWGKITDYFVNHPRIKRPNVMMGDLNMVEDAIDRYSMHMDNRTQVQVLNNLKADLHLVDGWRDAHPGTKCYTFQQLNGSSKSRIDRIYIKQNMKVKSDNWRMEHSGIVNTDHWMVLAKISNGRGPAIGKG
ncbi:DNase I-like protein [Pleurotus eryngii]|uniref:DNase I-like protein n=1 Tax=Pleurotus eryngii TaxID=5323 RepID=A0A9P5ZGH8_PLEER|nr:DNase I-like protein [Pleurotus eryngii]